MMNIIINSSKITSFSNNWEKHFEQCWYLLHITHLWIFYILYHPSIRFMTKEFLTTTTIEINRR